jgi:cell division septation protein DedD
MGPRLYPDENEPPHDHADHGFHDDPDDIVYFDEDDQDRRRFGFLRPVLLGIVAIGCAGALWFAYSKTRDNAGGAIPLIRADQSATKVRPDSPGGETVPDQDRIALGSPNQRGGKVERLLPGPEQPLPRAAPTQTADADQPLPSQDVGLAPVPKSVPSTPGAPAAPPAPASASGMLSTPQGAKSVAGIEIPPPPAAGTAPAKPGTATGPFKVQIAATRDEPTAQKEWERLKHAHADLLGGLSPTVVRADLGDKGIFFRIQAGPVPDQAKADKLCAELKKVSIACIIVKP